MPMTCMVIFGPHLSWKRRQQLAVARRLGDRIFDDQALAGGVEHLGRIEDRDVERRAAALGGLQARDLIGAKDDRLRHGGAGGAAECRSENIAMGLVPGAGKGRGAESLSLREFARGTEGPG